MTKITIIILLALTFLSDVRAQNVKVLASGSEKGTMIKVLSDNLIFKNGINVYRKSSGDWEKLTPSPLTKVEELKAVNDNIRTRYGITNDTLILLYSAIINSTQPNKDEQENHELAMLIKTATDNDFAKLLGVFYEDTSAVAGQTYSYRITDGKSDSPLGESTTVTAGTFAPANSPAGFAPEAYEGYVKFSWTLNNEFAGYNLYRSESQGGSYIKINDLPIVTLESEGVKKQYFFTDTTVQNGTTYYYKLAGLDAFAREGNFTEVISALPKDMTAPFAPRELQAEVIDRKVVLTWKNPEQSDIQGLNVYRANAFKGPYEKITASPLASGETTYSDPVTASSGVVYYMVASTDGAANEGKSGVRAVILQNSIAPAKLENLTARSERGKIFLTWNPAPETNIRGYFIYRGLPGDSELALLNAEPVKLNTFTNELPDVASNAFVYRVTVMNEAGLTSDMSEPVSIKMPDIVAPVEPVLQDMEYGSSALTLHWYADSDFANLKVYRSTGDTLNWQEVATLTGSDSLFADKNVEPNQVYYYYLSGSDSAGNNSPRSGITSGSLQAEITQVTLPALSNPAVNFDTENKKVTLNWDAANIPDLKGYIVFRKEQGEEAFYPTGSVTANSYEDTEIISGTTYTYIVKAYDNSGNSSISPEVTIKAGE